MEIHSLFWENNNPLFYEYHKKIMNKFSKKHGIRPEDTLEVFQEYLGNGEESKRIMEHENIEYLYE